MWGRGNAPPNFLTPRRLPAESRPFLEAPPPRLVEVRIWVKDAAGEGRVRGGREEGQSGDVLDADG